jgi:DUF4097 and DUF4098 domain-containing protein YvlB
MTFKRSTVMFLASGLLAASVAAPLQARTNIEENRPIDPEARIQIDNMAGSIEISSWDKAEVELRGKLGDRVEELEIAETTGGLIIRVHNEDGQRRLDESHLLLRVPVTVNIEAESISADITIENLNNSSMIANSVSGDITIDATTEHLEVESVSGDVVFRGQSSRATIETVSGEIEVDGVEGEVRFTTVSGDLLFKGGSIAQGRFETVSGDLQMELSVAEGGRLNADSMSGDVILLLPGDQQADFSAQTYSGDIRTDFGSVASDQDNHGRSFSHRIGNNGASIRIESFSGDARLKKR